MAVNFSWDYGCIQNTAIGYAENGTFEGIEYYIMYSNNLLLGVSLSVFYKIINLIVGTMSSRNYLYCSIVLNAILISGSIFLYYLIAKKVKGEKFALLMTIFMVMCLPISRICCNTLFRYNCIIYYSFNNIFVFTI